MNIARTRPPQIAPWRRAAPSLQSWLFPAVLGLVLMAVFLEVAASVNGGGWVTGADMSTLQWFVLHRVEAASAFFQVVSVVADPVGTSVTAIGVAVWLIWRQRDIVSAGYLIVVLATSGAAIVISKAVMHRLRPPLSTQLIIETNGSFPSGHLTGAIMVYGAIAVVLIGRAANPIHRRLIGAVAILAIIVVAIDRVYLGVHWLSDLVGSLLMGSALLLLLTALRIRTGPTTSQWSDRWVFGPKTASHRRSG